MKVQLTRGTIVAGASYAAGEVVDASDKDARYLASIGKAVPVLEAEKAEAREGVIATAVPGGKRTRK